MLYILDTSRNMRPISYNEQHDKQQFCLNNYDCLAFDMDHTMVQYHLPEIFKLIYKSIVHHLVIEKGYSEGLLHVENYSKYEDFSLRGLIFHHATGNFVKLDNNGHVLSCSHGMTNLTDDEIVQDYGKERLWPLFHVLKKTVYHSDGYTMMENFFLMPAASIVGQIVEDQDKKNGSKRLKDYSFIWKDVAEALNLNFTPTHFKEDKSLFFSSIRKNTKQFVKKCTPQVIDWLKMLRLNGKVVCLITDSYADFAEFLMTYAVGSSWKELFDYIIVYANKPNFFHKEFEERKFLSVNADIKFVDAKPVNTIQKHQMYARGNAKRFVEVIQKHIGKQKPKIVYFGDSIKSDVFPPSFYAQWDTVAVLEELEAEEVHFHKNALEPLSKMPKLTVSANRKHLFVTTVPEPLLKEEKLLIASNQWGSFFTHTSNKNDKNSKHELNTFWGDLVKRHSRLAIPLLDYVADLPLNHQFEAFSNSTTGFYPSSPRSIQIDGCETTR